jgi:hypothetical protein
MGVDTKICLPDDVQASTVAKVIGILLGIKPTKYEHDSDAWWTEVKGATLGNCSVVGCCDINISAQEDKLIDGETNRWFLYHFEPECGGRLIMPRSTPVNIAMGEGLVNFFGGRLVYSDHGDDNDSDNYYEKEKPRGRNNPDDGHEWDSFQQELLDIRSLTVDDIREADQYAAYKLEDCDYEFSKI